ncbi:AAA family ATPase [Nocardia sp. NPDC101769]|uniref:helix-turn-helix transcriptional regulator n=1 Tax=Nocardia sp. NPDC101769 TaxID=3364333 RepID=UPI0037F74575
MVNPPGARAFVGRASEATALLKAVFDDRIHTVLIDGEAGIGKSRLVSEVVDRLGDRVVTLIGRCPEIGSDAVPFAPFVAVMRTLLRLRGVEEVAATLPPSPALANWLPKLAARVGGAAADTDRVRLFGEVLALLEHLASRQPLMLVLEDLHWVDDSSRALLTFLVANLADGDITLVGTYRRTDAEPVRALISELHRNQGVVALGLHPFTKHEVGRQLASLLGCEPESRLVTRAFERSGGNPLFVEAIGQAPDGTSLAAAELLLGFQIGLAAEPRAVLRAAAVIGSPVRHGLLSEATELSQPRLYDVLRELIGRQLLVTTDTGYEFRHVLIRQAIYDDMLPAERVQMHARLVRALDAQADLPPEQSHSAELAHHAMAAGDLPMALAASSRAAALATRGAAYPEALRHLTRVLALWDRVAPNQRTDDASKSTVLESIIDAAASSGAPEQGIAAADAALALIDVDAAPRRAAELHYRRAYLCGQTGIGPGADLERALRLLPANRPDALRGEILAQRAASHVFNGNAADAARDADAAIRIAAELGDTALTARAYAYLGLATSDRFDVADGFFGKAAAAARAAGDPATLVDVAAFHSTVLLVDGRYRDAIQVIQQGLRVAHDTYRFAEAAPILLVKWSQALYALGHWSQARDVVDDLHLEQLPLHRAAMLICIAKIALAQSDMALARQSADEAAQLLVGGGWARPYRLQLKALQCLIALESDDIVGAAGLLAAAAAPDDLVATLGAHPHDAWPLLVLAARIPDAPGELHELAGSLPVVSALDAAHRAVYLAHRDPAATHWVAAAAAWQGLEQPYEQARCLVGAGQAHVADGDRAAAVTVLNAAADIAVALDAKPLSATIERIAQRARLALDKAPGVPRGPGSTVSFGLTPRELDVLRLLATGMSNRQLAGELFISANTAGVHVSRILAKLGVASRTEAVVIARQHNLLDTD